MTVQELIADLLETPQHFEILVSLFHADGRITAYPIDGIEAEAGYVHLSISEEQGTTY